MRAKRDLKSVANLLAESGQRGERLRAARILKYGNRFIKLLSIMSVLLFALLFFSFYPALGQPISMKIEKIDKKNYPRVKVAVSFSEILAENLSAKSFTLFENGKEVKDIKIEPEAAASQPVGTLLVIDVSGSMKGKPIEEAKKAAGVFLSQMRGQDKAGIVQFGSTVNLVSGLSGKKQDLIAALRKLEAGGNTALYDGIVQGVSILKKDDSTQKVLVVLSDGADNVSKFSYQDCLKLAKDNQIIVYAVGLGEIGPPTEQLKQLSKQTGGKFLLAPKPEELVSLYEGLAKEIYKQYTISYSSPNTESAKLDIKLVAHMKDQEISSTASISNPSFRPEEPVEKPLVTKMPIFDAMPNLILLVSVVGGFLSAFLLSYVLLSLFVSSKGSVAERLKYYERAWKSYPRGKEKPAETVKEKFLGSISFLAARRGFNEVISERLEKAGLQLRVSEFILFHFTGLLVLGLAGNILAGTLGLILCVVIGAVLPFVWLNILARRRQAKFEEQLPDTLLMIAGSLKAGYGLLQSIDLASEELSPPISTEFLRVVKETRLGLSIEESLENMAERVHNQSFDWTVMAMNIQKEVGGNLAEILETVADTLRKRKEFRRHVDSLTAEGRLSAIILILLPFVEGFLLYILNPSYVGLLFTTNLGISMVVIALVLMLVGWLWMKRVTAVEL